MSATPGGPPLPSSRPITLDDIRHKTALIREGVADEARAQMAQRRTQLIVAGAVAVVAVVSIAYFLGARASRSIDR